MNWPEVIGAVGAFFVTVYGALRGWQQLSKDREVRRRREQEEADRKGHRDAAALAHKERRESIDEWQEVTAVLRQDISDYRDQVHGMRNEMAALSGRVVRAEHEAVAARREAHEAKAQVEECEKEKEQLARRIAALEGGGR